MKRKLIKNMTALVLAVVMLFGAFSITAFAQFQTPNGMLGIETGDDYSRNYTWHSLAIGSYTYAPSYDKGQAGGGSGRMDILFKRISTASAISSVPLYRVSRSGGLSNENIQIGIQGINLATGEAIREAINTLPNINRYISNREAGMIQKVLTHGFKQGSSPGDVYSWNENLYFLATQILGWEIQEGKRIGFDEWSLAANGTNNMVGSNSSYWHNYWYEALNDSRTNGNPNAPDYYMQILNACSANQILTLRNEQGQDIAVTTSASTSTTITAKYENSKDKYQASFSIPYTWNEYGMDRIQFYSSNGNDDVHISHSGSVSATQSGAITIISNQPIAGQLVFNQNVNPGFNNIGYMTGTDNKWRGFIFGGNPPGEKFRLNVTTGGGMPIDVSFVDENGMSVAVNWSLEVNGIGNDFSETSSGKRFIPNYYINNHNQANYIITIEDIPPGYMPPKLNKTMFYYNGSVPLMWGTGNQSTGWGEWDYNACNASFDGQTITIMLERKINIRFIDGDTKEPIMVNSFVTDGASGETYFQFNNQSDCSFSSHRGTNTIQVDGLSDEYIKTIKDFSFSYVGGKLSSNSDNISIIDNSTIEISFYKDITIKFIDGDTKLPLNADFTVGLNFGQGEGSNETYFTAKNQSGGTFAIKPGQNMIQVSGISDKYMKTENTLYFSYSNNTITASDSDVEIINTSTIEIRFYQRKSITVNIFDSISGSLMPENSIAWGYELNGKFSDDTFQNSSQTFLPTETGRLKITVLYRDSTDTLKVYSFSVNFDGRKLSGWDVRDDVDVNAKDNIINIYLDMNYETDWKPISLSFIDKETNEPVPVTWSLYSDEGTDIKSETSMMTRFVPNYFMENLEETDYTFDMETVPPEYSLSDFQSITFSYDGKINNGQGKYTSDCADIDVTDTSITVYLNKTPPPPELEIELIPPNNAYHFGEEVITSYYLKNNSGIDYTTENALTAKITFFSPAGAKLYEETKMDIVCPGNATQLLYIKWSIPPLLLSDGTFKINMEVSFNGEKVIDSTDSVKVGKSYSYTTPPSEFDLGTRNFMKVDPLSVNQDYYNVGKWQEYVWNGSSFIINDYTAKLWNNEITSLPDETNPSAAFENNKYTSRSGYAVKLRVEPRIDTYNGKNKQMLWGMITQVQYAKAYYPEFKYSRSQNKFSTLERINEKWQYPIYEKSTYLPDEKGDGRKHFIPMWYPNGEYKVQCTTSGCWTPAGMISYTDEANGVIINGSMYDDWYSSGSGK